MKQTSRNILLLILCFIITCPILNAQETGLQFAKGRKRVAIPFTNFNNLILFKVQINDSDTLNFILDTGVKNTILIEKIIADTLGLKHSRSINLLGAASDQEVKAYVVDKVQLKFDDISGSIHSLLVLENDFLQLKEFFGVDIHGIIGYDIFRRFVVKVDYINHQFILYEPKEYKPPWLYKEVQMDVLSGKPYINAKIFSNETGFDARLMVDLGASHSGLFEIGSHDSLYLPNKYIDAHLGRGLGGEINGYQARIPEIGIGEFAIKNVIVNYTQPYSYITENRRVKRNGTIGGEILSRFYVIFDYFHQKMYLKKNRMYKKKFEYNMSGIEIIVKGEDHNLYYVNYISENSPAFTAGILAGDLILKINGRQPKQMSLDAIIRLFHSRPGKSIEIEILRNNQLYHYEFVLDRKI